MIFYNLDVFHGPRSFSWLGINQRFRVACYVWCVSWCVLRVACCVSQQCWVLRVVLLVFFNVCVFLRLFVCVFENDAKYSSLSFYLETLFGPSGSFFTNWFFFDSKADFRIEWIYRDIFRRMTHQKNCIKVCYGSHFNFEETSNTQNGSSIFHVVDEK